VLQPVETFPDGQSIILHGVVTLFYATAASAMRMAYSDSPVCVCMCFAIATKRNYKNKFKKSSCKDPIGQELRYFA
jgi:hypothetical protein